MRLIGFAFIVILIMSAVVYLFLRPVVAEREERNDLARAKWKPYNAGSSDQRNVTQVGVKRITPKGQLLEFRLMKSIPNDTPDYDNQLDSLMETARLRAQTLNIQNSID
jgi:hypothetical protein